VLVTGVVPNTGNTHPPLPLRIILTAAGTCPPPSMPRRASIQRGRSGRNALISGGDDESTRPPRGFPNSTAVLRLLFHPPAGSTTERVMRCFCQRRGRNFPVPRRQFHAHNGAPLSRSRRGWTFGGVGGSAGSSRSRLQQRGPWTDIFSKIYTLGFQPLGWALFFQL